MDKITTKYSILLRKVKELPQFPGVYMFKSSRGKTLYVGKAVRLRSRVASYFRKPFLQEGGFKSSLAGEIDDIEIRITASEVEALVLEASLIKTLKPPFNVAMKDDKQYFFAGFTKDAFPKIILTHQRHIQGRHVPKVGIKKFIGPFVNGRSLKSALRTLRAVFPYCTCKKVHFRKQACLNYHLGIDLGYCCSKEPHTRQEKAEYKHNLMRIKDILQGKKTRVINTLRKEMKEAASRQQFERASRLRNQREEIEYVLAHKQVFRTSSQKRIVDDQPRSLLRGIARIEGYDISNIQGQFAVGSMVVIARDVKGMFALQKSDYRRFKIRTIKGANDPAMIKEVICRRLKHKEWSLPDLMLIDGGIAQLNAAREAVTSFAGKQKPLVWSLAKKEEELYTTISTVSLDTLSWHDARVFKLLRDEAHRFAITYYRRLHKRHLTSL